MAVENVEEYPGFPAFEVLFDGMQINAIGGCGGCMAQAARKARTESRANHDLHTSLQGLACYSYRGRVSWTNVVCETVRPEVVVGIAEVVVGRRCQYTRC